jgi:serine-type D-Ala-D-Ala carboxypeptidase (penicillin-binding protein 5/6)
MNEDYPYIIKTEESVKKNSFPILAQLGILSLIMFGLFSSLWFGDKNPTLNLDPIEPVTNIESENEIEILKKISESDIQIRARSAYVWDTKTQRVIYSKNESEQLPLASITKLMTALLAYELIDANEITTISQRAVNQDGSSSLATGDKITAEKLFNLALVSSSNDAAYALGANVGSLLGDNDPNKQFVQGMNIRAEMLGLETLEFSNTTGLDLSLTEPGSIGSARDVSFLLEYILNNYPEILDPTKEESVRVYNADGSYYEAENTNEIIGRIPNLLGSKTGYTDLAGGNLTVAFDIGLNHPIIITVLGSTHSERFTDVLKLVKSVQANVDNN